MQESSLRAHGDSTGEINDFGLSARHDVIAAVEYLKRECPGRPVWVLGRSLGAAAALFAARELQEQVAGYILEQPYKDLESATWNRVEHYLPTGLDWLAYAGLRLWAPAVLPVAPQEIAPCQCASRIPANIPVVVLTGSADRHARLEDVEEVCDSMKCHAKLVVFAEAKHAALDRVDPVRYREELLQFLGAVRPDGGYGLKRQTDERPSLTTH